MELWGLGRAAGVMALAALLVACGKAEAPTDRPDVPAVEAPEVASSVAPIAAEDAAPAPGAPPATPAAVVPRVETLPVLQAPDLDARVQALGGRVTLVALWATWCKPCIEEMPRLAAFHDARAADGFRAVALSVDDPARQGEKIQAVLDRLAVPFPVMFLADGQAEPLLERYGDTFDGSLPLTLVLGPGDRRLVLREPLTDAVLRDRVAPLLTR